MQNDLTQLSVVPSLSSLCQLAGIYAADSLLSIQPCIRPSVPGLIQCILIRFLGTVHRIRFA